VTPLLSAEDFRKLCQVILGTAAIAFALIGLFA
jgi:hypothetical protein